MKNLIKIQIDVYLFNLTKIPIIIGITNNHISKKIKNKKKLMSKFKFINKIKINKSNKKIILSNNTKISIAKLITVFFIITI